MDISFYMPKQKFKTSLATPVV